MKFYIVTPAYNTLTWLQRCIYSVADQASEGVEVHHHVQDGASSDGTPEWLEQWQNEHISMPGYTFTYESGKDTGMYDALNKAWEKLPPDATVTAHLNSDEQYLPGALKAVSDAALAHQDADVLLTAYIVIDAQSRYICHRRPSTPHKWVSRVACEIGSCACFHKVDTFLKHGVRFDTRFRSIADLVMYRDIVNLGLNFKTLPGVMTSLFTITGNNLAWTDATKVDMDILKKESPSIDSWFYRNILSRYSGLLRVFINLFYQAPRQYSAYTSAIRKRVNFHIQKPSCKWGKKRISTEL